MLEIITIKDDIIIIFSPEFSYILIILSEKLFGNPEYAFFKASNVSLTISFAITIE